MATTTDDKVIPMFDLPLRLELARRHAGFTQEELADKIGMHYRSVSNYENGKHEPRMGTVLLWARICGVDEDWLLTGRMTCFSVNTEVIDLPAIPDGLSADREFFYEQPALAMA